MARVVKMVEEWYRRDGSGPIGLGKFLTEGHRVGIEAEAVGHDRGHQWEVLTVFVGLDYGHGLRRPPLIFESSVVGGLLDGLINRYTTEDAAVEGHKSIVQDIERMARSA